MKKFRDSNNTIWEFDDDCFDDEGNTTNEIVIEKIELHSLTQITDEEAEAIRNYKSPEQLAEEERLAKLPTSEELEKAKIELVALDLIMAMKEGGII